MTRLAKHRLIVIMSSYFVLQGVFAGSVHSSPLTVTTTEQGQEQQPQPMPGIIMIVTFENGTTKAISTDSTNIRTVQGGYFISDPSISAAKPLQSKTISNTVVQQLVSVFVEVKIEENEAALPPYSISSEGCGEGFGYDKDDPTPICEPIDKIGQGIPPPPSDQAFCAALGCPYNPPADSELPVDSNEPNNGNTNDFATTPVTPTDEPAIGPQPAEPDTEPEEGRDENTDESGGDSNGGSDEGNEVGEE